MSVAATQQPFKAILLKLAAVVLFVVMAAFIKAASGRVPPGEAVFFRSFFAIPIILGALIVRGQLRGGLKVVEPLGHLWRGLIGTCAMGLAFTGLALLPLAEVKAIQYAVPVLVVVFAAMFLGERVRAFRLTAVALGMVGVLIILSPRLSGFGDGDERAALGAMVVLCSAICAALAQVFVRKLVQRESSNAIVFWFSVTASCLALVTLPFGWVWPTATEAMFLIGAGLVGGMGQLFATNAYRYADVGVVAPFDYASMLVALTIGYFLFDEVPTLIMLAGSALVVAAGVLIIWRERQLGLERAKGRKVMTPQG